MTTKAMLFGLCLCVMLCVALIGFLLGYTVYLQRRNNRLEIQSDNKTELIILQNNRIEEIQKDYDVLLEAYKEVSNVKN